MSELKNKKIAKNTLLLYFRMFITMSISLYTSRVVLNALGITDFGIYNIVGGIVILFSVFNASLTSATQRFLNIEIGLPNNGKVKEIFIASINIHLTIAILFLLIAEILGVWYVNTHLNFPHERIVAVNWVFQLTIFTTVIRAIQVPYNASIIAYEKISFFAINSIAEAFLKLGAVLLLTTILYDKLITYSALIFTVTIIMFLVTFIYSTKNLESCQYQILRLDKKLYKTLINFSGWSLFGSISTQGSYQINNIILNFFYGVTLNASFGIATQVSNAVNNFVINFQTAYTPQLIKSYANNDLKYLTSLMIRTSKLSYLLILLLIFPILLNTSMILTLWLKIVPDYAVIFVQLTLIKLLISSLQAPFYTVIQATGKIVKYQLMISLNFILSIPLIYLFLKNDFSPHIIFIIYILLDVISLGIKTYSVNSLTKIKYSLMFKQIFLPISLITLISVIFLKSISPFIDNITSLILFSFTFLILLCTLVYFIGFTYTEKAYVLNLIKNKLKKK